MILEKCKSDYGVSPLKIRPWTPVVYMIYPLNLSSDITFYYPYPHLFHLDFTDLCAVLQKL